MTSRIRYDYADTAPIYGEHRPYASLSADDQAWWDTILARMQAVADAAEELGPERRDEILHAGGGTSDLGVCVAWQERALAAARAEIGA